MVNKKILNNANTNNIDNFNEAHELEKRSTFSRREVGLTHPDNSAFVRLNDRGEVEIFAGEELGIVISPQSGSISIFADVVKIFTKEDYGLRWNNKSLNYAADVYNEPSLVETSHKEYNSGFLYADHYLNYLEEYEYVEKTNNITTINGKFAFSKTPADTREESPVVGGSIEISNKDLQLLKEYALTNSQEKVEYMRKLLESGFNFSQAVQKTTRDKGA
jgi:hypothetical protein